MIFYQSVGLGGKSFTYPIITSALSLLAVLTGMYCLDRFGRRPVYIFGGLAQGLVRILGNIRRLSFAGFFIFLVAGLGGKKKPTTSDINGVVAASILYSLAFSVSWAPTPYVTAAEIATGGVGTSIRMILK